MPKIPQDKFRIAVKRRLLDDDSTVTALAKRLDLHRNTVSQAINHPILPTVRTRIARELHLPLA